jgi:sucrose-6-phosphate hydrolase SacC (GH32 family)
MDGDFHVTKRINSLYILFFILVFISCRSGQFCENTVSVWNFHDEMSTKTSLKKFGDIPILPLHGTDLKASKVRGGDGFVAKFGKGYFDAGQGVNGISNLSGKSISILVRVKANRITGFTPILSKSGNDQSVAYSIALNPVDNDVWIETLMGSDEIAGAHLLKCKMSKEDITKWHDIILRFDGHISQLYVDGELRDDEVTVGNIRDWNVHPLIIGAADNKSMNFKGVFDGEIDYVALFNRCLSDNEIMKYSAVKTLKDSRPVYYSETYRPQFHFSAKKNWINDPNGLVFYDGVYHLFFQYMPPHRPGAYKDWGHAVSTDLVHWTQIPNHITPHIVWGGCWSGSAVVDNNNSSGFQVGEKKAIVAFITTGGVPSDGIGPLCTQCLAYSTDGGMTFSYYDQNPVIKNINMYNRDPKVAWDNVNKLWVMSLYLDKGSEYGIFTSDNLKNWKQVSTFVLEGASECPGFEPMPVDNNTSNMKWIFWGANGKYQIGSFDGIKFHPETGVLQMDYGKNFYAGQTWSDLNDGRFIYVAWMPTNRYPGMPFEQQLSFPNEFILKSTANGLKLYRMPIREISKLYDKSYKWDNLSVKTGDNFLKDLDGDLYDMQFVIDMTTVHPFDIDIRGANIHFDPVTKKIICKGPTVKESVQDLGNAPLNIIDGKLNLRILVDRTSIEIFGNNGEMAITSNFMPSVSNHSYAFRSNEIKIKKAEVYSLKSAWTK